MQPFTSHTGIAVPLLQDDINTDQITPVHRSMKPDYAKLLFARTRLLHRTATRSRTFRSTSRSSRTPASS